MAPHNPTTPSRRIPPPGTAPTAGSASPSRGTWQEMIDICESLLVRATGEDSDTWAARVRAEGLTEEAPMSCWMRSMRTVRCCVRSRIG